MSSLSELSNRLWNRFLVNLSSLHVADRLLSALVITLEPVTRVYRTSRALLFAQTVKGCSFPISCLKTAPNFGDNYQIYSDTDHPTSLKYFSDVIERFYKVSYH